MSQLDDIRRRYGHRYRIVTQDGSDWRVEQRELWFFWIPCPGDVIYCHPTRESAQRWLDKWMVRRHAPWVTE